MSKLKYSFYLAVFLINIKMITSLPFDGPCRYDCYDDEKRCATLSDGSKTDFPKCWVVDEACRWFKNIVSYTEGPCYQLFRPRQWGHQLFRPRPWGNPSFRPRPWGHPPFRPRPWGHQPFGRQSFRQPPYRPQPWGHQPFGRQSFRQSPFGHQPIRPQPFGHQSFHHPPFGRQSFRQPPFPPMPPFF